MGYGLNRFVASIDQNLICSICSCVLENAVLTPCGHSFCSLCLDTWLARPGCTSCPECRGLVNLSDVRAILSVRNLINNMHILCDFSSRGCRAVIKLEELDAHLQSCEYVPVECAGCGVIVNRHDLADHHIKCDAIAAAITDEEISSGRATRRGKESVSSPEVAALFCRAATLEIQLKRMKHDLDMAEAKNKKLDRELKKTKEELADKRNLLLDQTFVDFDPDYEYGYAPHSVSKLSCLIARFLLQPPTYIDPTRVFNCVKRCYDNFGRVSNQYEHETHMLLATAYASFWFNDVQKLNIHHWLQRISRNRLANEVNSTTSV